MYDRLKEILKPYTEKIPLEHQLAINSFDWMRKCHEIGKRHNLSDDVIYKLNTEIGIVLVGAGNGDSLNDYIEKELDGDTAEIISGEIVEVIFNKLGKLIGLLKKYNIKTPSLFYFEDLYKLDIPTLFKNSKFAGSVVIENSIRNFYDTALETKFLNAFDTIRIGIFGDEKDITGSTLLELTFYSKNSRLSQFQMAFVIDSIGEFCKSTQVDNYIDIFAEDYLNCTKNMLLFDDPDNGEYHNIIFENKEYIHDSVSLIMEYESFLKWRKKYHSYKEIEE